MVESDQATLPNLDSISLPAIPETVMVYVFVLQYWTITIGAIMEVHRLSHISSKVVPDSHSPWAISIAFPLLVESAIFNFRFPSTLDATRIHSRWERNLMRVNGGSGLFAVACMTLGYSIPFPYSLSWRLIVYLPYNLYLMVCYASCMFWRQKEVWGHERYLAMAQPGRRLGSSYCALAYAGELLFFYIFVFSPEGTWKDWWTEYLP